MSGFVLPIGLVCLLVGILVLMNGLGFSSDSFKDSTNRDMSWDGLNDKGHSVVISGSVLSIIGVIALIIGTIRR